MNEDGVALFATAHPRAAWYKRLWTWLRRPYLSPDSLETVEIEVREPPRGGLLNAAFFGRNPVSNEDIEKEIIAKGLTAPRVTLKDIEAVVTHEFYFTASQGISPRPMDDATWTALSLLTFCVLVLKNGFTVTGESACASPENFNAELGRKVARQNAVSKVWMLEGYLLKERLHAQA
jgi:N4 Gp49/Sf6 Gp66 family protein